MATTDSTLMTTKEFLQLPEDENVTRELIDGQLRERTVTTRSLKHSIVVGRISHVLIAWLDADDDAGGVIATGEVRCRLSTEPDTMVGIDVAWFTGEEAIRRGEEEGFYDGPPVVAVEVLSPSDTHEDISDKIHRYLAVGTKQVWVVDPDFRTVTVYRTDRNPVFYNAEQELDGAPELSGFRVNTGLLFASNRAEAR